MLEYFRGNTARNVDLKSLANVKIFPDYLEKPAFGWKARFVGNTNLGRASKVRLSSQVRYEPMFTPGLEEIEGGPGLNGAAGTTEGTLAPAGGGVPEAGLFLRKSWVNSTKVDFDRQWSRSDTTRLYYNYFIQRFTTEPSGQDFHVLRAEYHRNVGRAVLASVNYEYLDGDFTSSSGETRPRVEHAIRGGASYNVRLGREREAVFSLAGGAAHIASLDDSMVPYEDWVPTGSVYAQVALTPAWLAGVGYQRRYTALQSLTGQLYSNDSAYVSVSGPVSSRLSLTTFGTVAGGDTLVATGVQESYSLYGASVSVRFQLSGTLAATADYFYYSQRYSVPASLPTGFPGRYDRNVFRVGLTFWMPLTGAGARPRAPESW